MVRRYDKSESVRFGERRDFLAKIANWAISSVVAIGLLRFNMRLNKEFHATESFPYDAIENTLKSLLIRTKDVCKSRAPAVNDFSRRSIL